MDKITREAEGVENHFGEEEALSPLLFDLLVFVSTTTRATQKKKLVG